MKTILHKLKLIPEYRKYTKSCGFMGRVFCIFIIHSLFGINSKYGGLLHEKLKKEYIFTTPFGKFLGGTSNARSVMQENYELETKKILIRNSKKYQNDNEKYFLNIGAHVGRWAIDLAKNHNYKGLCFEPSPETFKSLQINTILSDVKDKLTLYNYALGDKEQLMKFSYISHHDGGSYIIHHDNLHNQLKNKNINNVIIEVPMKTLDGLIGEDILNKTRLILMDVEGFELNVLKGMKKTLAILHNVDFVMEIFQHNPKKVETIALMEKFGFTPKQIGDDDRVFSK